MADFLDYGIVKEAQQVMASNNLFHQDPVHRRHFNFICASLNRVSTAVDFLNKHSNFPENSANFIHWLVYGSMLKEAIYYLFKNLNIDYSQAISGRENYYFKTVCDEKWLGEIDEDDTFFSRLRALIFAHPTDTHDHAKQPKKLYSPLAYVDGKNEEVCAMVYISGEPGVRYLRVPFSLLKEYINSRYQLLNEIIAHLNNIIKEKNEGWKQRKVNKNEELLSVLKDIVAVLEERYMEHYEFDELITYSTLPSSIPSNDGYIAQYRRFIVSSISLLCSAVDNMDYDKMFSVLSSLVGWGGVPDKLYEGASYDLEKIFGLSRQTHPSDVWYIRQRVRSFSDNFAKKWVTIDADNMDFDEMKLLVAVACYCEKEEQKKKGVIK